MGKARRNSPASEMREPATGYAVQPAERAPGCRRAKLFRNGRSQAVRLPKEFRLAGTEVLVHREGRRVVLEPLDRPACDANGWPLDLWTTVDELRDGLDPNDFKLPADPPPDPAEFAEHGNR